MNTRILTIAVISLLLGACAANPLQVAPAAVQPESVALNPVAPSSWDYSGAVLAVPADNELTIASHGERKTVRLDGLNLPPANSVAAEDARRVLERALLFREVNVVYLHGGYWNPAHWFGTIPANVFVKDTGLDVRAYLYISHVASPKLIEVKPTV